MRSILALALLTTTSVATPLFAADSLPQVDVYKSATCGCCARWAEHMRASGFVVLTHDVPDVAAQRQRLGIADALAGCHTAVVNDYVIEGHVPAGDVKRLLAERPKAVGLAVPNMPGGSPGMENAAAVPYEVLLINANGSIRSFARH